MAVIIGRGGYVGDTARRLMRLETLTNTIRQVAAVDVPGKREGRETPYREVYTTRNPSIPCVQDDQDGLPSMWDGWMPALDLGWVPTVGGWHQSIADGCRSVAQ